MKIHFQAMRTLENQCTLELFFTSREKKEIQVSQSFSKCIQITVPFSPFALPCSYKQQPYLLPLCITYVAWITPAFFYFLFHTSFLTLIFQIVKTGSYLWKEVHLTADKTQYDRRIEKNLVYAVRQWYN